MKHDEKRKWVSRMAGYNQALAAADTSQLPDGWKCTISADPFGGIILLGLNAAAPKPAIFVPLESLDLTEVPAEHALEWLAARLEVALISLADYIQHGARH